MALYPPRHPLLRQPSHVARINERHWLARDLVFAHSGYGAFIFGRPQPAVADTLRGVVKPGTHNPALGGAFGWVPDGSGSVYFAIPAALPLPLTISAWWHGTSSTTNDAILAVGRSAGRGGVLLRRSTIERVSAQSTTTGGVSVDAAASGGYSSGRWQHGVGVFASDASRAAYADGANNASETTSNAFPADCDQIRLATTVTSTPTPATTAIAGIAIPLVIARALDDEEIARLHDEQRSTPWGLFAEQRIWVPVSAAGVGGTLSASEAGADTAAATGDVLVQGTAAAAETGADALAAAGTVRVAGALAAAETGGDALAATGRVRVAGTAAATETGADALAAVGAVRVAGTLDAAETGPDVPSLAGRVLVQGALAATDTGADTSALTGRVILQGTAAAAEAGADAAALTGRVLVQALLAAAETGADTATIEGQIFVAGVVVASEAAVDSAAATGSVLVRGLLAALEGGDDAADLAGQIVVHGACAAAESAGDTFAADGAIDQQLEAHQLLIATRRHMVIHSAAADHELRAALPSRDLDAEARRVVLAASARRTKIGRPT